MATGLTPPRIVILGGGYAGLYACRALARQARRGRVHLTVVSRENFHVWHGFIGEMLTGRIQPSQILSPARRIFRDARLHIGVVDRVDTAARVVHTHRELDGQAIAIPYDRLIVCVGSRQSTESFHGLAEHGFALKTWDDCFRLRNHIIRMYELASITTDPDERRALLTFFVAGGGFSGAEVAGELADFATQLAGRDFPEIRRDEVRVVLAHPQETILPELYGARVDERQSRQYPGLVTYAEQHLRSLGVEVRTGCRIRAVSPTLVELQDGATIPTRTVISAVGTVPQALTVASGFPVAPNGRMLVDTALRVPGLPGVYAAGDCAAVAHPKGGYVPTTAWWGMMAGACAARNVMRELDGREPRPFRKAALGQAVSIGRRTAVGELKGIALRGWVAWLMWRVVLFWYFPFSDRKIRLLVDWIIWPFLGRDIVEMSTGDADDFEMHRYRFQPGETIIRQGQQGHTAWLITEGTCVTYTDTDGDRMADERRMLGPGAWVGHDYPGQISPYHLEAHTVVRAVAVRVDQLEELRGLLRLHVEGGAHG